jgi:hypothetical protein
MTRTETAAQVERPGIGRAEVVAGLLLGLLFLVPLLVYGPIDTEEGALGVFASQIHYRELFHGRWIFWLNELGFGTPLPIGQRLDVHPIFALGSLVSLRVALSALWLTHVAVMAIYFQRLAAALGIAPGLRLALLACYLFSAASVCLFYQTDWASHVVAWTLLPAIVFYLRQAIDWEAEARFWRASLRLALLCGLWVVNSHPGYIGPLALVLTIYVVVAAPPRRAVYACLLIAAALGVAVSAERLYFFATEVRHFPPDAARYTADGQTIAGYGAAALAPFTSLNPNMRLPFIGLVFGAAALVACYRVPATSDRHLRATAVAFASALVLSLLKASSLAPLLVVSAVWTFRDPMIFFGLLAGAAVLQRMQQDVPSRRQLVWLLVVVQLVQQAGTVAVGFEDYYARRNTLEFYRHQLHEDGLAGMLAREARASGPRVYFSGAAQDLARGTLSPYGLHFVTDLVFLGLNPVTAWFKSISMDRLYPSPQLMHGYIHGERDVLDNRALLDVLSVNTIVTTTAEGAPPEGLATVGRIPTEIPPQRPEVVVMSNPDAWPAAVLLSTAARTVEMPRRPSCSHDRALCRDFTALAATRLPDAVTLTASEGHYAARFAPAERERVLFVPATYREEWTASSPGAALPVDPIADAFLGVTVPPQVGSVDLDFRPRTRMALAWFSNLTLAMLLCAFGAVSIRP